MVMPHAAGEVGPKNDLGADNAEVGLTSGVDAPKVPSNNFIVGELQKLLRAELANPGARRKQGPVILRDPSNPSVSVNLDDLIPGHLGGYKAPLVRREFGVNKQEVKSRDKGGKPLAKRKYRENTDRKERRMGGIPEPTVMVARLRAALLAVSNGGNQ